MPFFITLKFLNYEISIIFVCRSESATPPSTLLNFFDINQNKRIIFASDFNIFFGSKLEARRGKPILKKKSIIKLLSIKERLDICDIWRIRNPKCENFIFGQNHSTGFIECRLDYILVSNCLEEFVN